MLTSAAVACLATLALPALGGSNGHDTRGYSATNTEVGFDKCEAPTINQMQNWWTNSPYFVSIAYIGGANRSCGQANLNAAWISSIHAQGWGLLPTWVGRQAPDTCNSRAYATYISTSTTTARSQGIAEATAAYQAASSLGMDLTKVPLIYNLEAYDGGTTCRAAVKAFIDGWTDYLFKEPGETFGVDAKPGVYGSACGSFLDDFYTIANRPGFIWFAWWNGNKSTSNSTCIGATHWTGFLRHKQYLGSQRETWGGLAFTIDNDCSYGPVYDDGSRFGTTCE